MQNGKHIRNVILDLDQTLTVDQGSWSQFTQLLGADVKTHENIYERFKNGELSYTKAKQELIDLWRQKSDLDRESIVSVFEKVALREDKVNAVHYLKKEVSALYYLRCN